MCRVEGPPHGGMVGAKGAGLGPGLRDGMRARRDACVKERCVTARCVKERCVKERCVKERCVKECAWGARRKRRRRRCMAGMP